MALRASFWSKKNIAERLSFSSFSTSSDDYWAADIVRPYKIVILPGYSVPAGLDRDCKDALWVEGDVSHPTVVWDGFCPYALFEIVRECFDPLSESDCIVVQDEQGQAVTDDRPVQVMKLRPRKGPLPGPKAATNRIADLYAWSLLFRSPGCGRGGAATFETYRDIVSPAGAPEESVDSFRRAALGRKLGPKGDALPRRAPGPDARHLSRGPVRRAKDPVPEGDDKAVFDTKFTVLAAIEASSYGMAAVQDLERAGGSFYRLALLCTFGASEDRPAAAVRAASASQRSAASDTDPGPLSSTLDGADRPRTWLERLTGRRGNDNPY